jgi:hypothetical protein
VPLLAPCLPCLAVFCRILDFFLAYHNPCCPSLSPLSLRLSFPQLSWHCPGTLCSLHKLYCLFFVNLLHCTCGRQHVATNRKGRFTAAARDKQLDDGLWRGTCGLPKPRLLLLTVVCTICIRQGPAACAALTGLPPGSSVRAQPAAMQLAAVAGAPVVGSAQLCSRRARKPAAAGSSSRGSRQCRASAVKRLDVQAVSEKCQSKRPVLAGPGRKR